MSGHSKWANIKRKKEKQDSKRGKVFTKLGREIAVAVKKGGTDPSVNTKLKDVISKAKYENMPSETIEKNIKKAFGMNNISNFEEITYEGYGPGGVAIIVETMTDNRNRTAGDVRHYFDKFGGNLGTTGCVTYLFDKKGQIVIEKANLISSNDIMEIAINEGAQDFIEDDQFIEIICEEEKFSKMLNVFENQELIFIKAEIAWIPKTFISKISQQQALLLEKLFDHLEDLDDVKNVYSNLQE